MTVCYGKYLGWLWWWLGASHLEQKHLPRHRVSVMLLMPSFRLWQISLPHKAAVRKPEFHSEEPPSLKRILERCPNTDEWKDFHRPVISVQPQQCALNLAYRDVSSLYSIASCEGCGCSVNVKVRTSLAAGKDSNLATRKKTFKNHYRCPAHRHEQIHFVHLEIPATVAFKATIKSRLQYCGKYCGKCRYHTYIRVFHILGWKKKLFEFEVLKVSLQLITWLNSLTNTPLRPSNTSLISFSRVAMSHSWDSQVSQNTSRFSLAILLVGCRARVCAAEMIWQEQLRGNAF